MNMREKVGGLSRGLQGVEVSSHGSEIYRKVMLQGYDVISHVTIAY